ncbi:MAG: Xaa-Pro aminopeptidase [Bacteroidales bacterium]|jgi:Xaa-Pro aminopeptidase|nr:Xaa-Pro aminopeptidase [Bacteroidales bacterium]
MKPIKSLLISLLLLNTSVIALNAQFSDAEIYAKRRADAIQRTGSGAIVIPGTIRTPYGQTDGSSERYFRYLTGWESPGAWMVLAEDEKVGYTLFITPGAAERAVWENQVPDAGEAKTAYGADKVYPMTLFSARAAEILSEYDTIWTTPSSRMVNETISSLFPGDKKPVIMDIRKQLSDMRLIKDDYEISLLREAAIVTAEAHREAMMLAAPGRWEYELEAAIEHTFRSRGCDGPGFTSIIGSGANSTILHYDLNSRRLEAGDVIVMDIGAKCNGYIADVTRTIPASGQFSPEQLEIYNIVLEAQNQAISEMKPGKRSLGAHDRATEIIMKGLNRLGLVTDPDSPWQKKLYILYTCTHHIGLDVHDTYPYQLTPADEGIFRPGMVITIEPGIYMNSGMLDNLRYQYRGKPEEEEINAFISQITPLFRKYMNIGIRIEDDILITEDGNINLSEAAPREPSEIERLMRKRSRYE